MNNDMSDKENKHLYDIAMKKIEQYGSINKTAQAAGVSRQYFQDVVRGDRMMSEKIYNFLGYKRVCKAVKLDNGGADE